ncbi:MAG: ATP-binding protein [Xanthomonadales bacterium]|nr:ATP-binding protein [Xanthomonadales bacterium]MBK7145601.1 ATP-binding protein [Xanthomonadales bacterium]
MSDFNHPLLRTLRSPIATRAIERLSNAIIKALQQEFRGIVVYGLARFGKSWAIKYLIAVLTWLDGDAYVTSLIIPKSHARSDGAFFSLWLSRFKLKLPERTSALARMERVRNFLIARCEEAGSSLIIVFIDEAQRLFPDDYEHLATLDNELTDLGYMLFVVLVYQMDYNAATNEKIYDGGAPAHVHQRFLVRRHEFTGLNGPSECAHAMSRYDQHAFWPVDSGISYTRHFATAAFDSGWRLEHHAERLHEIASELRIAHRLPSRAWTWPMKSFEVCINILLTIIAPSRSDFSGFTDDDLRMALNECAFIDLELSRTTIASEEV